MGLPLPGESLLVGAALYAGSTHRLDINLVVLVSAAAAILGDNAGYGIGRAIGRGALRRYGGRVWLTPERLDAGERLFQRHGAKVVLFGRFVGVLRTFAAVLAGANRMPWPKFLLANAAGGILWTCLYGDGADLLGARVKQLTLPLGLAIAAAAVAAILIARRQAKRAGLA